MSDAEAQAKALQRLHGQLGGFTSWRNTTDRADRLANTWAANPTGLVWHARRIFGPDVELDDLTPQQVKRAQAARKSWYGELTAKSRIARQRRKARQLREQAALLEAEADNADKGVVARKAQSTSGGAA